MPATLNTYLQQCQRFLRDAKQELWNPDDLREYCNQARREVAMRSQCIRVLPAISGAIIQATITNPGSGYTSPTVAISGPDMPSGALPFPNGDQATGVATQSLGLINNVDITYGGAGYFQPTITITDPTGTGAVIEPVLSPINAVTIGREVYNFSDVDLSPFPGVASIYTVRSVSLLFTNYRYSVPIYDFSTYQARIRQYSGGSYQYIPCFGAQFGRGVSGSFFLYPPPSQTYLLEWDCSCLPQDLTSNQSVEAIPDPWTDTVSYYMAHLAYLEGQNHNAARSFLAMFDDRMRRMGSYVDKGRAISKYGRP